jgi:serine/alanine adding enzyme
MNNLRILTLVDEIDKEVWNDFVFNHPNGNFFQTPIVFDFFTDLPGYKPVVFLAKEAESIRGVLVAILMKETGIKGYFSRRCIIWGGPLCHDNETLELLISEFIKYIRNKSIYIEVRNLFDTSGFSISFLNKKFSYIDWLNYIVPTNGIEGNKKKLNESKRRQIQRSLKTGAKIGEAQSIENVRELYELLFTLYKEKIKKPLPGFRFFENFYLDKKSGKIFIIEYENKIIGGAVCPIYKDRIYEWYVCGLDKELKNIYPSALATWAPIEYAANNGLKYFDFMGAGSPNADYGVREFKSQFGGELVSYGRYIKILNPFLYKLGVFGIKYFVKFKL